MSAVDVKRWILGASVGTPAVRLFCIPHAGGNASLFRTWSAALAGTAEVCAVQLPGRLSHFQRPPLRRLEPLADELAEVLGQLMAPVVAIFGHCTGSLLAYEAAQRLAAQQRCVAHLFVSCSRAPHLRDRDAPIHGLPEPELVKALEGIGATPPEILRSADMLGVLLPMLRADFEAAETYQYHPRSPLACDVTAFGGDRDPLIQRGELEQWACHTNGRFTLEMFGGGHQLLETAEPDVLATIRARLSLARRAVT